MKRHHPLSRQLHQKYLNASGKVAWEATEHDLTRPSDKTVMHSYRHDIDMTTSGLKSTQRALNIRQPPSSLLRSDGLSATWRWGPALRSWTLPSRNTPMVRPFWSESASPRSAGTRELLMSFLLSGTEAGENKRLHESLVEVCLNFHRGVSQPVSYIQPRRFWKSCASMWIKVHTASGMIWICRDSFIWQCIIWLKDVWSRLSSVTCTLSKNVTNRTTWRHRTQD